MDPNTSGDDSIPLESVVQMDKGASSDVCSTENGELKEGAGECEKCSRIPASLKLGLVVLALIFLGLNIVLYASPSTLESVGQYLPDSLSPKVEPQAHDRGSGSKH